MTFIINFFKDMLDGILEILLRKLLDRQLRRAAEKLGLDSNGTIEEISNRLEKYVANKIEEEIEERF